jgi:hypothetical protein
MGTIWCFECNACMPVVLMKAMACRNQSSKQQVNTLHLQPNQVHQQLTGCATVRHTCCAAQAGSGGFKGFSGAQAQAQAQSQSGGFGESQPTKNSVSGLLAVAMVLLHKCTTLHHLGNSSVQTEWVVLLCQTYHWQSNHRQYSPAYTTTVVVSSARRTHQQRPRAKSSECLMSRAVNA